MEKNRAYELAKLELIYIEAKDIIATSTPEDPKNDGGNDGLFDKDAWT